MMAGDDDRGPWVLVLTPLNSDTPAIVRLRRALKCLLRGFRLRAVEVRNPVTPAERAAAAECQNLTGDAGA